MSNDEKSKSPNAGVVPDSAPEKYATKIRITEDSEAIGEVAAAYDFWRAGSGRNQGSD